MLLFRIYADGDVANGLGGMVRRFTAVVRDALTVKHAGMKRSRHAGLTIVQLLIQCPIHCRQFKVFLLLRGCTDMPPRWPALPGAASAARPSLGDHR